MPLRIRINDAALQAYLYGPNGPVMRYMEQLTQQVQDAAERYAPGGSGGLRGSFSKSVRRRGNAVVGTITNNSGHAVYVHEGTGLYGPKHQFIYPATKKVMVFPARSGGGGRNGMVFARRTKGMRGTPYYWLAMELVLGGTKWKIRRLPL